MTHFTESVVEDAALAWLEGFGYAVLHGPGNLSGFDPLWAINENPDRNRDNMSGFGVMTFRQVAIPPFIPPKWRDSGLDRSGDRD